MRIGIPRVLNIYSTAPFFRTYFEAIGIPKQNVVFSDETTEEMWVEGGKYGSIDPCYPSKVAQAHIHNLLFDQHTEKKPLKYIFFPILTHVHNFVVDTMDNASCPIVAGAPDVMKAAFTKEVDFFATRGIEYLDPALSFVEPTLMARRMFETFGPRLGITEDENDFACQRGVEGARRSSTATSQEKGRAILETVEAEDRVAILMLGRPYHSDPGLNHGIPEEFQVLGYPILVDALDPEGPRRTSIAIYKEELEAGLIKSAARAQPRVAGELLGQQRAEGVGGEVRGAPPERGRARPVVASSAATTRRPTASSTRSSTTSKTPYAALHDIDANKPGGSIKIRVKTYAHALKLHEERLEDARKRKGELLHALDKKRLELLELRRQQLAARKQQDPALERRSTSCARRSPRTKRRAKRRRAGAQAPEGAREARTRRPPTATSSSRSHA